MNGRVDQVSDTQGIGELMSAVIDGEADPAETDRVLAALRGDEQLRQRWQRLHELRHLLAADQSPLPLGDTLERRFAAALAAEPEHDPAGNGSAVASRPAVASGRRRWFQLGGAVAVAVAVALTVVIGSVTLTGRQSSAPAAGEVAAATRAAEDAALDATGAAVTRGAGLQRVAAASDIERETRALMLMHVQHAAVSSRAGMVPVAKLAAFQSTPE